MNKHSENYVASLEKQVARAAKQKEADDAYIKVLVEQCRIADELIAILKKQVDDSQELQKVG